MTSILRRVGITVCHEKKKHRCSQMNDQVSWKNALCHFMSLEVSLIMSNILHFFQSWLFSYLDLSYLRKIISNRMMEGYDLPLRHLDRYPNRIILHVIIFNKAHEEPKKYGSVINSQSRRAQGETSLYFHQSFRVNNFIEGTLVEGVDKA